MQLLLLKLVALVAGIVLVVASMLRFRYRLFTEVVPVGVVWAYPTVLYAILFLGGTVIAFVSLSRTEKRKIALLISLPIMSMFLLDLVLSDYPPGQNNLVLFVLRVLTVVLPGVSAFVGMYMMLFFREGSFKADGMGSYRGRWSSPAKKYTTMISFGIGFGVLLLLLSSSFDVRLMIAILLGWLLVQLFKPSPRGG